MLQPRQLVEDISRRVKEQCDKGAILGYWYQVHGGRRDYADQIRTVSGGTRIVPLVVSTGFVNVNELMVDLSKLISNNESAFQGVAAPTQEDPVIVLLLSHGEFQLPQVASPATLPPWFPG